jgi:hypothetical protein
MDDEKEKKKAPTNITNGKIYTAGRSLRPVTGTRLAWTEDLLASSPSETSYERKCRCLEIKVSVPLICAPSRVIHRGYTRAGQEHRQKRQGTAGILVRGCARSVEQTARGRVKRVTATQAFTEGEHVRSRTEPRRDAARFDGWQAARHGRQGSVRGGGQPRRR